MPYHVGDLVDVATAVGVLRGNVLARTPTPDGDRYAVRIVKGHEFARGTLCAVTEADCKIVDCEHNRQQAFLYGERSPSHHPNPA